MCFESRTAHEEVPGIVRISRCIGFGCGKLDDSRLSRLHAIQESHAANVLFVSCSGLYDCILSSMLWPSGTRLAKGPMQ